MFHTGSGGPATPLAECSWLARTPEHRGPEPLEAGHPRVCRRASGPMRVISSPSPEAAEAGARNGAIALAGLDASACAKYAIEQVVVSAKSRDQKRPGTAEGAAPGGGEPRTKEGRASEPNTDVAIVCGVSDDGQGLDIIRKRGERIETGTVRRLEQGKPIHGEVVRLRPRDKFPMICDVEVEVPGRAPEHAPALTSGPAQVATETYRKNWDAIYGRKPGSMLN
jgi:hypothetical protein